MMSSSALWTLICQRAIVCDVPGLAAGTHRLEAHIDADNDIAESDETDNDGYGQFSVEE